MKPNQSSGFSMPNPAGGRKKYEYDAAPRAAADHDDVEQEERRRDAVAGDRRQPEHLRDCDHGDDRDEVSAPAHVSML